MLTQQHHDGQTNYILDIRFGLLSSTPYIHATPSQRVSEVTAIRLHGITHLTPKPFVVPKIVNSTPLCYKYVPL